MKGVDNLEEYVRLAFDKLGFPNEMENPDDINHITEYVAAKDTVSAVNILETYPVLFKDPTVLSVISLVRNWMLVPPAELIPQQHKEPITPASPEAVAVANAGMHAPHSSSASSMVKAENAYQPSALLTDQKVFTILASIADGSLTSLQYDFKTHTPVVVSPTLQDRMMAIKLLKELGDDKNNNSTQVNIINSVSTPPSAPHTTPASHTSTSTDTSAPNANDTLESDASW